MNVVIEESWKKALENEFTKPYFLRLVEFVKEEYKKYQGQIFPKGNELFRAFEMCPLDQVKVVILGQDPYPTRGHAHGLCFSVEPTVRPFPKSLLNIFKEIQDDLDLPFPENGSLLRWAEQGVLLLNSTLSVREGTPKSHAGKGWEVFTDAVLYVLSEKKENIVYLLWGADAQQKAHFINKERNLVLSTVHPSPLSAYRGFFGCKHFSRTNEYLKSKGLSTINW